MISILFIILSILSFKPTKNESSVRKIKVNQKLLQLLHRLKINTPSNLVFMNQFGTIPTSGPLNKKLHEIMSELHIEKDNFHFHSLRHVHVAYLLSQGVDIYAIRQRLGHKDISTTTKDYAPLIKEMKAKLESHVEDLLDGLNSDSDAQIMHKSNQK